jgi:hypothetical protein
VEPESRDGDAVVMKKLAGGRKVTAECCSKDWDIIMTEKETGVTQFHARRECFFNRSSDKKGFVQKAVVLL